MAYAINVVLPGPLRSFRVAGDVALARLATLGSDSGTLLTLAPAATGATTLTTLTTTSGSTRKRGAAIEPLPCATRPQSLTDVWSLATDAPAQLAGVATARAAGAAAVLVPVDQLYLQAFASVVPAPDLVTYQ